MVSFLTLIFSSFSPFASLFVTTPSILFTIGHHYQLNFLQISFFFNYHKVRSSGRDWIIIIIIIIIINDNNLKPYKFV